MADNLENIQQNVDFAGTDYFGYPRGRGRTHLEDTQKSPRKLEQQHQRPWKMIFKPPNLPQQFIQRSFDFDSILIPLTLRFIVM